MSIPNPFNDLAEKLDKITISLKDLNQLNSKLDNLTIALNTLIDIQQKIVAINSIAAEPISSEFIFIQDVKNLLNMPIPTIRYHIAHHNFPCFSSTRPLRFKRDDVLTWFKEYTDKKKKKSLQPLLLNSNSDTDQ